VPPPVRRSKVEAGQREMLRPLDAVRLPAAEMERGFLKHRDSATVAILNADLGEANAGLVLVVLAADATRIAVVGVHLALPACLMTVPVFPVLSREVEAGVRAGDNDP